jgi:hypothetical protein
MKYNSPPSHHLPLRFQVMAVIWLWLALATAARSETNTIGLGFTGPEMFPIEPQISLLRAADLDGDGRLDIVVANNARSRLNILWNRSGLTNESTNATSMSSIELNELPPDARFHISSIASEKRISGLVLADLNHDGKPDLAYYGEPKELVVQYNQGDHQWSSPQRWKIADGLSFADALVSGDLNGDHLQDLLLLGEKCAYYLPQLPDGKLGEPERLPYSDVVKGLQILDIDGDGREDLLLVNGDHAFPIRFRLQNEQKQLGPEVFFSATPFRAYLADDLNQDGKAEIVTITLNSGRAELGVFQRQERGLGPVDYLQNSLQVLPLNKTSKDRRGLVWSDLNDDGRPDLLVADPEGGQLNLLLQRTNGTFSPGHGFPSLTGIEELAAADWDGDHHTEIFLLSSEERQVGVTRLDEKGRLAFPEILPLPGRPLAMVVGQLTASAKPILAVICDQDGKRLLATRSAQGEVRSQKLSDSFKSNPSSILLQDVDQDGLMDLVVMIRYEKIKILRQVPEKDFEEIDLAAPGGASEQPWATLMDVDQDGKPELLLAQKNFVRAVVMVPEKSSPADSPQSGWTFKVKEQINGSSPDSRIIGATAFRCSTNRNLTIFLLDAEHKALTCCERDETGGWQPVRNLQLPLNEFSKLDPLALGAPVPNSVAFTGANTVAWMEFQGARWEITSLAGYETNLKGGHLTDVVTGDLNRDGLKDLIFLDMIKNYIDIVKYTPPGKLESQLRWQVFETRSYRSQRPAAGEPREAIVADFTGDGKNDIAVLVNDRVLLYPQD